MKAVVVSELQLTVGDPDYDRKSAARKSFHAAFRIEMSAAFERTKKSHPGIMDQMSFDEFETWYSDRTRKLQRIAAAQETIRDQNEELHRRMDAKRAGESATTGPMSIADGLKLLRRFDEVGMDAVTEFNTKGL